MARRRQPGKLRTKNKGTPHGGHRHHSIARGLPRVSGKSKGR